MTREEDLTRQLAVAVEALQRIEAWDMPQWPDGRSHSWHRGSQGEKEHICKVAHDALRAVAAQAPAKTTFMWAEDSRGAWWRVEMRNGEPYMSYHPNWGYQLAFRDSFRRWHIEGESAPLGEPTAPRLEPLQALVVRWRQVAEVLLQRYGTNNGELTVQSKVLGECASELHAVILEETGR